MKVQILSIGLLLLGLLLLGQGVVAKTYLSMEKASRLIFPEAEDFLQERITVTPLMKQRMKQLLGRVRPSLWEETYPVFIAKRGGKVIGYGVVVNEIGKHRAITFMVGVTPTGKVKDVVIMVYRESRGGEVRNRRFLRQYRGKDLHTPILPPRGIQSISGATLSSYAISRGVKKALALINLVYLDRTDR